MVCGRAGIRRGYHTGRSTIVVRARAHIEEHGNRQRIVITEIPFQQARDRIEERIAALVNEGKIPGISGIRNESDLKEPVRLVCELKRDADPDIVLNQLYQFSPLQDSFSLIFLALVDGKPRVLSFKELLQEFIRHRETVIRRRTQFLLARARQRKHTVEGLLLAHANIDEVIRVIRSSSTQAEAKERLMQIQTPAALLQRALGEEGFAVFVEERGASEFYTLTPVQADAILHMTLGQLVNLEQEKLADEHRKLLEEITEYRRILSDRQNILDIIRDDCRELKRKHGDARRTEISGEEVGELEHGRPDHRRDDGRLDQQQRLHQADAGLGLSRPAPRRQGPDRRQDRRGRPDPAPVRRQHPRLSAVLHQQGQGLLAQGLRPAAVGPRRPRPGRGQPAEPRPRASRSPTAGRSAISTTPTISW